MLIFSKLTFLVGFFLALILTAESYFISSHNYVMKIT